MCGGRREGRGAAEGSQLAIMKEMSIQGRSNYNEKRSEDVRPNGEGERGRVRASEDR